VISAGPITIDPEKREARVHGDLLLLAADEFDLLAVLAAEPSPGVDAERTARARLGHGWLKWVARRSPRSSPASASSTT
jgi:DNA-binding response OmpR family regulator